MMSKAPMSSEWQVVGLHIPNVCAFLKKNKTQSKSVAIVQFVMIFV